MKQRMINTSMILFAVLALAVPATIWSVIIGWEWAAPLSVGVVVLVAVWAVLEVVGAAVNNKC